MNTDLKPQPFPPAAAPSGPIPATLEAGAERGGGEPQSAVEWVKPKMVQLEDGEGRLFWVLLKTHATELARRCDAAEFNRDGWMKRCERTERITNREADALRAKLAAAQAEAREYKEGLLILSKLGTGPCGGGGALDSYNHGIQEAEARVRKMARDYMAKHAKEGGE